MAHQADLWKPALEDALALIANISTLAGLVYSHKYGLGIEPPPSPSQDRTLSQNYAQMLRTEDSRFDDYIRLYLLLHADHDGGNASAFTSRVVQSAGNDVCSAVIAGIQALGGDRHGLANQKCLEWMRSTQGIRDGFLSK